MGNLQDFGNMMIVLDNRLSPIEKVNQNSASIFFKNKGSNARLHFIPFASLTSFHFDVH